MEEDDEYEIDFESLSRPTQESLDLVVHQADAVRICDWAKSDGQTLELRSLLTVAGRSQLDELLTHLQIVESDQFQHCMCIGSLVLRFTAAGAEIATLTLHHGTSIRWDEAWNSDATLRGGLGLAHWFAERGIPRLLTELEESRRAAEAATRAWEGWRAAMPPAIQPFYPNEPVTLSRLPLDRIRAALETAYEDEQQLILALCDWNGSVGGEWKGFYPFEVVVTTLLNDFGAPAVVKALDEAMLTDRQMEGLARYVLFRPRRVDVPPQLARRLRAYAAAVGNEQNIRRLQVLLGTE